MNLFELSAFLSPVLGVAGGLFATIHRHSQPSALGMIVAIPVGIVCGITCYRGLMRLAVWKAEKAKQISSKRAAALLGVGFLAPYVSAALSFVFVRVILYVAA